jgi:hypothetical protein
MSSSTGIIIYSNATVTLSSGGSGGGTKTTAKSGGPSKTPSTTKVSGSLQGVPGAAGRFVVTDVANIFFGLLLAALVMVV